MRGRAQSHDTLPWSKSTPNLPSCYPGYIPRCKTWKCLKDGEKAELLLDEATMVRSAEEQEPSKGSRDCSSGTALVHIAELRSVTCQKPIQNEF